MAQYRRILTLDIARRLGWADWSAAAGVRSSVVEFTKAEGQPGRILSEFLPWLERQFRLSQPELVAYEMPIVRGAAGRYLMVMGGMVDMVAWRHKANATEVNLSTIKKHATGNGHAEKPAMVAAAKARGWTVRTDDEADVLWLMDYVRDQVARGNL